MLKIISDLVTSPINSTLSKCSVFSPPQLIKTIHVSLSFPLLMSSLTFLHQAFSHVYFPSPLQILPRRLCVQDIAEHSVLLKPRVCLLSLVFILRTSVKQSQKICFLRHYYSPLHLFFASLFKPLHPLLLACSHYNSWKTLICGKTNLSFEVKAYKLRK